MKTILKILLIINLFLLGNINAKEQYSKENITKHLETLFTKNIRYEEKNKYQRYIPFRNTIRLYYEFSPSIQNQKEKINILKELAKKFEKVINLQIELKAGKPDITLEEKNAQLNTVYNSEDSLYEEHIYFDFATRDEIFVKLKEGFWNKKLFLGKSPIIYQKYIEYMKREREASVGKRRKELIKFDDIKGTLGIKKDGKVERVPAIAQMEFIKLKNFHLLEVSNNRDKNFKEFLTKELYLSLLPNATKLNVSKYIQPSTINRKYDDYKKGEISWFDWIVLDEFYNNKQLEKFMLYKTEVIPILTEAIYKKIQKGNK